ncbi:MAG: TRAM domain-containing protein [Polyangiales bacterium]
MRTGETAHVSVNSLTLEGEGVARLRDGQADRAVLVRGAFPGEDAEVRIEALSRHHARAHARLLRIDRPHPARRAAPCPRHESQAGRCAGCALMEVDEPSQRDLKRAMLRDRFGLEVAEVIAAPHPLGYRASSKRVVFAGRASPFLGSYAHGGHAAASMTGCLVDHPLLVRAFDAVEAGMREARVVPYDERRADGDLRYVWAKTNGHEVIVTLVSAHAESQVHVLLPRLREVAAGVLHSVQPSRGNALRGGAAELLWGAREVAIRLLGQQVEVGALGFLQPNPEVAELAYRALVASDDDAPRGLAFDLYAGAGLTTRALRTMFAEVRPVEAHPESADALGVAPEAVEPFLARMVDQGGMRPDLVIANPPRKGMGPAVCARLLSLAPTHLRVMSCGPEGLARDLEALAPGFALTSLLAFDTLPQTPHVELVASLTRR